MVCLETSYGNKHTQDSTTQQHCITRWRILKSTWCCTRTRDESVTSGVLHPPPLSNKLHNTLQLMSRCLARLFIVFENITIRDKVRENVLVFFKGMQEGGSVTPQNVIIAAKCNTNAKCNNIDAECNKVFNTKCNNFCIPGKLQIVQRKMVAHCMCGQLRVNHVFGTCLPLLW